jgi:CRISPR-associated protein Csd2
VGEVTDVCLKRKLRDRLMEEGHAIFVQSDDRKRDEATSLRDRAEKELGKKLDSPSLAKQACEKWLDVRAFGQLFAFKATGGKKGKGKEEGEEESTDLAVSIGIRGPVTVQSAFSLAPVEVTSTQITKSVSGEDPKAGKSRASDTMGMKHRVDHGVYRFFGSMNPQLAERTGFSDADADAIKKTLPRLFENDASSARPEGSMRVLKVVWWKHSSKAGQYSSARVHGSLDVAPDGAITLKPLAGLQPEEFDGF